MIDKNRLYTTLVYVGSLLLTLFSAFVLHSRLLVFIFVII